MPVLTVEGAGDVSGADPKATAVATAAAGPEPHALPAAEAVHDDTPEPQHAFADSRRLTGPNRWFNGTAVSLAAGGVLAADAAAHARWATHVQAVANALNWPAPQAVAVSRLSETTLSFAAPQGLLFTATEVNEWAWEAACRDAGHCPSAHGLALAHPWALPAAMPAAVGAAARVHAHAPAQVHARIHAHFSALAAAEWQPALQALRQAASAQGLPMLVDDEALSIGTGCGSSSWLLDDVPAVQAVPWHDLRAVPTALVTGSNGKTTTVRLLAAMAAQAGLTAGFSSTEAVVVGGQPQQRGDYAGPAGARAVLRDRRVQLAVLETARGGLLRRGLALDRADVAVVTNLAADHFGEYGIESLDDLAEVKLVVARALPAGHGLLVLNADDAVLMAAAARLPHAAQAAQGLFALDHDHPLLLAHRARGGVTCGVHADGQLRLHAGGHTQALGAVAGWPLSLHGAAPHNIANAAAAALAAWGLGLAPAHIAAVLQTFGADPLDNPGRLERWAWRGATVLVDYAHNPEGLAQLLQVARALLRCPDGRPTGVAAGRLGLVLGQAGNRSDQALADLAHTAASFRPDRVVLKELPAMLRGRAAGSVSAALAAAMRAAGMATDTLRLQPDEEAAARELLAWARAGDVVVLPMHTAAVRERVTAWLQGVGPAA